MRFALLVTLLLTSSPSLAEGIGAPLAGHRVVYFKPGLASDRPVWQEWAADGTTRRGGGGLLDRKSGHWKIEKGQYCDIFGMSDEWTCWKVTFPAKVRIRFWQIPQKTSDVLFHQDMKGVFVD